jgi:hypothetical protein
VLVLPSTPALAESIIEGSPIAIIGGSIQDDHGNTSLNVSGVACVPPGPSRRLCVVIDDESRDAQVVFLTSAGLEPAGRIPMIRDKEPKGIVGSRPADEHCGAVGGFKDLDGEAVAFAEPFFYVVGSHGCSRKTDKFHLSSFITARFRLDENGFLVRPDGKQLAPDKDPSKAVQTTFRVGDELADSSKIQDWFARPLQGKSEGMNIEGAAVFDGKLYVGLRAPSTAGVAWVVAAPLKDLFFPPDSTRLSVPPMVTAWPLGDEIGIRDLSPLPDGRVVVLSGPTLEDPETPFELWTARFDLDGGGLKKLGKVEDRFFDENGERKRAKAEAVLPIAAVGDHVRVIVFFDGLPNGGPIEYYTAP